jgi:hypothetical protein
MLFSAGVALSDDVPRHPLSITRGHPVCNYYLLRGALRPPDLHFAGDPALVPRTRPALQIPQAPTLARPPAAEVPPEPPALLASESPFARCRGVCGAPLPKLVPFRLSGLGAEDRIPKLDVPA